MFTFFMRSVYDGFGLGIMNVLIVITALGNVDDIYYKR